MKSLSSSFLNAILSLWVTTQCRGKSGWQSQWVVVGTHGVLCLRTTESWSFEAPRMKSRHLRLQIVNFRAKAKWAFLIPLAPSPFYLSEIISYHFPLPYSVLATLTWLFLVHTNMLPATGPLHCPFPLQIKFWWVRLNWNFFFFESFSSFWLVQPIGVRDKVL